MKKKGIAIVAILLVIAIAAGALFIYNRSKNDTTGDNSLGNIFDNIFGDDDFVSGDNTSSSDDISSSDETTSTPVESRYIDVDGYGYQTVGGSTAFFKVLEVPAADRSAVSSLGTYGVVYDYATCLPYSNFNMLIKWSLDGILWNDFTYQVVNDNPNVSGDFSGMSDRISSSVFTVYVSYTFVDNCASPKLVLSDLKTNVFTSGNMFEPYLNYIIPSNTPEAAG